METSKDRLYASLIYRPFKRKPLSNDAIKFKLKEELGIEACITTESELVQVSVTEKKEAIPRQDEDLLYKESLYRSNMDFVLDKNRSKDVIFRFCNPTKNNVFGESWLQFDKNLFNNELVPSHKYINVRPFSFGSLVGMNTFVEHYGSHWSADEKVSTGSIQSNFSIGSVEANFEHVMKKLIISFPLIEKQYTTKKGTYTTKRAFYKLEILYTAIQRLLVHKRAEKKAGGRQELIVYDLFLQLAGAPFILKDSTVSESDSEDNDDQTEKFLRVVEFGKKETLSHCSKSVIGMSRVLKLKLVDQENDQCITAMDIIGQLARCCKFAVVYFTPMKIDRCPKAFPSPSVPKTYFDSLYALKCVLTFGYEVADELNQTGKLSDINRILKKYADEDSSALAKALYDINRMLNQADVFCFTDAVNELFQKYKQKNDKEAEKEVYCIIRSTHEHIKKGKSDLNGHAPPPSFAGQTEVLGTSSVNELSNKKNISKPNSISNIVELRRVIVTPTRLLFLPPLPQMMTFLLRSCNHKYAMRLTLRDDDYDQLTFKLKGSEEERDQFLWDNFLPVLKDGIKIGDRRYMFFGSSTSQLREHGILIYATDNKGKTAEDIRQSLGALHMIKEVPKYMARMGQSLSQAIASVPVDRKYCNEEPEEDIERNKYCFTDGVGKISEELMNECYKKLALPEGQKPSAIQVRYGGCKGMLVVDNTLKGLKVIFRKSQWKYDSKANSLEILKFSRPRHVYLNRPFLTILEQMGVPLNVFVGLQSRMLEGLVKSLFDNSAATKLLRDRALLRLPYVRLSKAGFDLSLEPFFRPMVMALYRTGIDTLKHKARIEIPISEGRTMFGVVDETSTLKYGQIFVQYTKVNEDNDEVSSEKEILKGTILVTKNPCMHPGDVRKFEAVDVEALHHISDCIVFPSKGPRPHPDEMAGSDLDGDEYCVIWHKPLYFERPNHDAMNYRNDDDKSEVLVFTPNDTIENKVEKMGRFLCYYIRSDSVGLIASAHLAWADQLSIFDDKCMAVAKKFSVTLDFAKSGKPTVLTPKEKVQQYPDFMEKLHEKHCYLSTRALGTLYRNCRRIDLASEVLGDEMAVDLDPDLIWDGNEKYRRNAVKVFEEYKNLMEEPSKMFCIVNEGELLSGAFSAVDKYMKGKNSKENLDMTLGCYIPTTFQNLRRKFFQEFDDNPKVKNLANYYMSIEEQALRSAQEGNGYLHLESFIKRLSCGKDEQLIEMFDLGDVLDAVFKKASAWYQVAYSAKKDGASIYLGLPWTVCDVLILMKQKQKRKPQPTIKHATFVNKIQAIIDRDRDKIHSFLSLLETTDDARLVKALLDRWLIHHRKVIILRTGYKFPEVSRVLNKVFETMAEGGRHPESAAELLVKVLTSLAQFTFTTQKWEHDCSTPRSDSEIEKELGLLSVMALANLTSTGNLWGKSEEPDESNIFGCSFLDDIYREEIYLELDRKNQEFFDCILKKENEVADLLRRSRGVNEVKCTFRKKGEFRYNNKSKEFERNDGPKRCGYGTAKEKSREFERNDGPKRRDYDGVKEEWCVILSVTGKRLNIELLKDFVISKNFREEVVAKVKEGI